MDINKNRLAHFKNAFNFLENAKDIFIRPHDRFSAVDGIRGLAIIYTLIFHAMVAISTGYEGTALEFVREMPWYLQWIIVGDRGVDAFFVISGFLIGQMLFKEHVKNNAINVKRFLLRRFLRLAPVYYLLLLLCAFTAFQHKEYLWFFAFYLNNFLDLQDQGYLSYTWSLAVEEQFYILFSLFLGFAFYKIDHKFLCLLALYLLSLIIPGIIFIQNPDFLMQKDVFLAGPGSISPDYWEAVYDNLYTRYGALMSGVILAYIYVYYQDALERFMTPTRSNGLAILALGIFASFSFMPLGSEQEIPFMVNWVFHVFHRHVFGFAVALIVLTSLFNYGLGGIIGKILSSKPLFPFSQLSYSMYLIHPIVLIFVLVLLKDAEIFDHIFHFSNALILGVCSLPFIFIVSALLYIFIERPFMKLRS